MARSRSLPSKTNGTELDLTTRLRRAVLDAPTDLPLPTTRDFGKRFGVANVTAFRVLQRLAEDGEIWQHPTSGRYYPTAARSLFDRPQPIACLIRRLELASEQYREILEGVSLGSGTLHRTMLLWHDELLVNHPEPHLPPSFAPVVQQRAILGNFLERHGKNTGSFLLDHIWRDEALNTHSARLTPGVVLYRTCNLPGFSNIRADFRSGAFKALTHLLARGFDQILPVEPFSGDPAVGEFLTELEKAAKETGSSDRLNPVAHVYTDNDRTSLIEDLKATKKRTALVCPEDNVALILAAALRRAGLACPERVGLLSVMGTDYATKAGISCLRYDYRAMGRLAVEALAGNEPIKHVLEAQLSTGTTT